MKLKFLVCVALATLIFASCDDNTDGIGISLVDNMDHLEISTDTFTVTTRSIIADSVLSRNTTAYLGKIRDPETGAYITGNSMIQFHTLEDYSFPNADSIKSKLDGLVVADSCEIRLYYTDFYGDSLSAMKMTAYEMEKPMEDGNFYSNFDPYKEGYVRTNGIKVNRIYSLTDLNLTDSTRKDDGYTPNIRIKLNMQYTDKDGVAYNNYGTYIMRKYYEHPSYFKNSYNFIHNVVPGFYLKNISGLGSMAYINLSQLNIYFRYETMTKSSTGKLDSLVVYRGTTSFAGTEEVLQTTTVTNDNNTIAKLAADNTCTYLKTPAGIFTEMTLPIDDIMMNHKNDTINTAKVSLTRINNSVNSKYSLGIPQKLLMIPKDSLYSFFKNEDIANFKSSFITAYSSSTNTYTFNNISGLVSAMYRSDRKSANWNKVILVPVTVSTNTSGILTKVVHDMSLTSTKLVGGTTNPITLTIIYSKFK